MSALIWVQDFYTGNYFRACIWRVGEGGVAAHPPRQSCDCVIFHHCPQQMAPFVSMKRLSPAELLVLRGTGF